MTVWDDMAEDLSADDAMSQAAVFTPAAGDPVWIRVDLVAGEKYQPGGLESQTWGSETTIEYVLSALGREANPGETFTMDADGAVYTVSDVLENDGWFVKVAVK